jgi:lipoprotein-anchoring transpeptidase ErfK/SrfK
MRWGLSHPNADGAPLVLLVLARRPGGLLVRIPARPNGATGWIATADVATAVDPYALRVSLRQHQLTVSRLGVAVRTFRLGVGRPDAPTPTGRFFLTELVRPPDPRGPLGPVAFGISAFSDVYNEFAGGIGQIGLHGTNDPSSIGRNVSHGCLRVSVAAIRTLARLVPVGTPITIDR